MQAIPRNSWVAEHSDIRKPQVCRKGLKTLWNAFVSQQNSGSLWCAWVGNLSNAQQLSWIKPQGCTGLPVGILTSIPWVSSSQQGCQCAGRANAGQLLQAGSDAPGVWIPSSLVMFQPQWSLLCVPGPAVGQHRDAACTTSSWSAVVLIWVKAPCALSVFRQHLYVVVNLLPTVFLSFWQVKMNCNYLKWNGQGSLGNSA